MPREELPHGWIEVPLDASLEGRLLGLDANKISGVQDAGPDACVVYSMDGGEGFDVALGKSEVYRRIIQARIVKSSPRGPMAPASKNYGGFR